MMIYLTTMQVLIVAFIFALKLYHHNRSNLTFVIATSPIVIVPLATVFLVYTGIVSASMFIPTVGIIMVLTFCLYVIDGEGQQALRDAIFTAPYASNIRKHFDVDVVEEPTTVEEKVTPVEFLKEKFSSIDDTLGTVTNEDAEEVIQPISDNTKLSTWGA